MSDNTSKNDCWQVTVTAKFWFVSDLDGGAAKAEELVSKYLPHQVFEYSSNPGGFER